MTLQELWNNWNEYNNDEFAAKRIKSAQSAKLTPVYIDTINGTGSFTGSHGKYEASLESCPCRDFIINRRPCKHIYRIAMETKLLNLPYKSDSSMRVTPGSAPAPIKDTISIIEGLSEDMQIELKDLLYSLIYHNDKRECIGVHRDEFFDLLLSSGLFVEKYDSRSLISLFKRNELNKILKSHGISVSGNLKLSVLVDWCYENILDQFPSIFSEYTTICFSEKYLGNKHKMYKYLHRKFDFEFFLDCTDGEISIPLLQTDLPDDQITNLLSEFGHYKKDK